MTVLDKISLIVLGGAVAGAAITTFALYFVLVLAGVPQEEATGRALIYGALIGVSFLVPVYVIRVLIDKYIMSRVKNITEVILRITEGDVDAKVNIDSDDEIGRMAEAFERMRRSLKLLMSKVEKR
ncbi:HAMP domain-containing protein [Hydrogenivirga caldilitoris]|uniref:histidine kinase n=1 Tax=Hydrogenivirga caldilitoris TaxID=246264 RepID=A0A497XQL1_9AQUI|nr:HAMP domain-containing protein [Hydrogenivirga caldilitoris]RLJ71276.1 HAMP domain-containing protein [Hydrogenivirga caldilitoris]